MEKPVATLDKGTICSSWNYSGQRLATGLIDGTLAIFDSPDPASSSVSRSFRTKVHTGAIFKVLWLPPEYGDAVACLLDDGSLSLWEELAQDGLSVQWKFCSSFESRPAKVLDVQFGVSGTSLKMVTAYSDGYIKVHELTNPLELKDWQLQAEFQNVTDAVSKFGKVSGSTASISWIPQRIDSQHLSFVVGFVSDVPQLNSSKVWEFDEAHQRWVPVAELTSTEDNGLPVYAVAWAPNIGRPYETVAVATQKGIALWHVGLHPNTDGRLSVEQIALLSGHAGQVWQMEWDMSAMTLATTGSDGLVRLWQSNLNGVWDEQAVFRPTP